MRKDKIISLCVCGDPSRGIPLNILTPVRAYSERENRYLQGRPTLSMDRVLSGQFGRISKPIPQPVPDAGRPGFRSKPWQGWRCSGRQRPGVFGKQHRLFGDPGTGGRRIAGKNCLAVAGFLEKVTRNTGDPGVGPARAHGYDGTGRGPARLRAGRR